MIAPKRKIRVVHLKWVGRTVAEIYGKYYAVIGNSDQFRVSALQKDWGKGSRWGRYIKQ